MNQESMEDPRYTPDLEQSLGSHPRRDPVLDGEAADSNCGAEDPPQSESHGEDPVC
jgi:hypothetical protein